MCLSSTKFVNWLACLLTRICYPNKRTQAKGYHLFITKCLTDNGGTFIAGWWLTVQSTQSHGNI